MADKDDKTLLPVSSSNPEPARPTHHNDDGTFKNPWESFKERPLNPSTVWHLWKDMEFFSIKTPSGDAAKALVDPVDAKTLSSNLPGEGDVRATWLGHACFLLQSSTGLGVLTDPIFSDRCSPVQFAGPKRYTPPPCTIEAIRDMVHVVIISHNHYDHLDLPTLKQLNPDVVYFVPMGNAKWIRDNVGKDVVVHECDWWDEVVLDTVGRTRGLKVTCTPCQHFTGRSLNDRFHTLWASWCIQFPTVDAAMNGPRVFFGGDTGYRSVDKGMAQADEEALPHCPAFKEIGAKLGPFDLAMIPIGAYSPRWFMSPVHCDPSDAVLLHKDVRSRMSVGMHWGTFTLTDEPVDEPPVRLREALKRHGVAEEEFVTIRIGASIVIKRE